MEVILSLAALWLVGKVVFLIWYCIKYGYPYGNKELNEHVWLLSHIWFVAWPFWAKLNPNNLEDI